jgi:FkbM family methyltransferase
LDPGETALDVGANLGQMTSLMRHCSGPTGRVIAFEPHPDIFQELSLNMQPSMVGSHDAPVTLHQLALGEQQGFAVLDTGPHWAMNRGMSKLVTRDTPAAGNQIQVQVVTLDNICSDTGKIGVCKIDVEGHELQVLHGASQLISRQQIRDIVFEDFGRYPSPVHQWLLNHGYTIYRLCVRLHRPVLLPADRPSCGTFNRPSMDCLATLDPQRAVERWRPWGWQVFRRKKSSPLRA